MIDLMWINVVDETLVLNDSFTWRYLFLQYDLVVLHEKSLINKSSVWHCCIVIFSPECDIKNINVTFKSRLTLGSLFHSHHVLDIDKPRADFSVFLMHRKIFWSRSSGMIRPRSVKITHEKATKAFVYFET